MGLLRLHKHVKQFLIVNLSSLSPFPPLPAPHPIFFGSVFPENPDSVTNPGEYMMLDPFQRFLEVQLL